MNTGSILAGRPSLGAWVTYGLGSANQNLPAFVVLLDDKEPVGGAEELGRGFLPATYQGTQLRQGDTPILHLKPPNGVTDEAAARQARIPEAAERAFTPKHAGRHGTGSAHPLL